MSATPPRRSSRSASKAKDQPRLPNFSETPAKICAIGVGGGGSNAIMRMMKARAVPGVTYICVNTDVKSLAQARGARTIQIGEDLTRGMGAGGNPETGAQAADLSRKELEEAVAEADLVFLAIGMGGGTGTGAAPVVADIARSSGALVVAVATTPFAFEGARRMETAHAGIGRLRPHVNNLIVIHNDRLLDLFQKETTMDEALRMADDAVMLGVLSVAELVNLPGEINVDLADVKAIMGLPGEALMAIGEAKGDGGPLEAARQAVGNPLLDLSIEGAQGVLFNVKGGPSMTLADVNAAGEFVASQVSPNAMIFFGMVNAGAKADKTQVTIIATGIPGTSATASRAALPLATTVAGRYVDHPVDLDIPPFLRRPSPR
jgi:cell division protein FtsZ